jgi:aryl-alcohol dehydrogenase-like predicted oxidoreductase
MAFGREADEPASVQIMDRALELGVNFFDTANVYGRPRGVTEEIVGRWLAQDKRRREKIVLATKVYGAMDDSPNAKGVSAYNIRRECEASLRRLQTDHIDLYQMHHIDRETPWEETWQAMETLVQQGKVIYVGSSNFPGWCIAQAQAAAAARDFMGLVSEQSRYNLAARTIELEVVPACRAYGLALLAYGPLRGGMLAGSALSEPSGRRAQEGGQKLLAQNRPQVEKYEALCQEIGIEPALVAQAWLAQRPWVTIPILGPRTVEQMENSLRADEVRLPDEVLARLDEIWPGPGQAPEAYAW